MRSFNRLVGLVASAAAALTITSRAGAVPSASFQPRQTRALGASALWTAKGDFNGDGRLDASVGTNGGGRITTFYTLPNGTFPSTGSVTTVTGSPASRLSGGDFNNDGRADLIYLDDNSGMKLRFGQSNSTFSASTTLGPAIGADFWGKTTVGDLNHDGRMDAMIAYARSTSNTGGIGIAMQQPGGGFQTSIVQTSSQAYGITNADLNADGFGDVIVGDSIGDAGMKVAYGSASGAFAVKTFAYPDRAYGVIARDFNGDGIPDVAATAWNQNSIGILLTQPNGDLGPPSFFVTATSPNDIATGDFNGDGIVDLVTSAQQSTAVGVHLGNGDGTFLAPLILHASASGTSSVTVGDFDGNGGDDIIVAAAGSQNLDIFYNSVPEPGALSLLSIAGLLQMMRPRRG